MTKQSKDANFARNDGNESQTKVPLLEDSSNNEHTDSKESTSKEENQKKHKR